MRRHAENRGTLFEKFQVFNYVELALVPAFTDNKQILKEDCMNLDTVSRAFQHYSKTKIFATLLLAFFLLAGPVAAFTQGGDDHGFDHVFVIMMENTGYDTLIGNSNAPFINFVANTTGLATKYYGIAHPSQPNYIAATSGALNGVVDDNDITIDVPNIVDQLEAHGKTWKAYMQSYSLCSTPLDHACGNQLYERKHNPFISYANVQNSPARVAKIVDFTQLATDLSNNTVPDYVWISPDQCNDMHGRGATPADPCDFSQVNALISAGDTFLLNTVNAIMTSKAWTGNSVIFIVWDESDFTGSGPFGFGDTSGCCDANPGGGHVLGLVISNALRFARSSGRAFNHYSMLATIQESWHLGCLGNTCDRRNVKPMRPLAGPLGL
jgi:phosphatidylinositol-3-phosphatase